MIIINILVIDLNFKMSISICIITTTYVIENNWIKTIEPTFLKSVVA